MLESFRNKITSKIGLQVLAASKNTPTALFAVGVVGVVATAIFASRATLQMDEVLREGEDAKAEILAKAEAEAGDDFDPELVSKDGLSVRVNTALKIAKIYLPAVISGAVSIAALSGSHVIMTRRYTGAVAAFTAVSQGFRNYRQNVVQEFGPDKDLEFRRGVEMTTIAVDQPDGSIALETVKKLGTPEGGFVMTYGPQTSRHWSPDPTQNAAFLKSRENLLNQGLASRGFLLLNEVLEALGMEHTTIGCTHGWVMQDGVGYVDLGLLNDYSDGVKFLLGEADETVLDPNVQGEIYHLLDVIKASGKRGI